MATTHRLRRLISEKSEMCSIREDSFAAINDLLRATCNSAHTFRRFKNWLWYIGCVMLSFCKPSQMGYQPPLSHRESALLLELSHFARLNYSTASVRNSCAVWHVTTASCNASTATHIYENSSDVIVFTAAIIIIMVVLISENGKPTLDPESITHLERRGHGSGSGPAVDERS